MFMLYFESNQGKHAVVENGAMLTTYLFRYTSECTISQSNFHNFLHLRLQGVIDSPNQNPTNVTVGFVYLLLVWAANTYFIVDTTATAPGGAEKTLNIVGQLQLSPVQNAKIFARKCGKCLSLEFLPRYVTLALYVLSLCVRQSASPLRAGFPMFTFVFNKNTTRYDKNVFSKYCDLQL